MKHITDQNWFAVALDVVVVISGIFLGMQATEWNESRKSRELETDYLVRLYDDFTHNKKQVGNLSELHSKISNELNDIGKYLLLEELGTEQLSAVNKIPLRYFVYPSANLRMGTYQELVSTGKLSLIKSSKIKAAIQQTSVEHLRTNSQLEYFRALVVDSQKVLGTYAVYTLDEEGNVQSAMNYQQAKKDNAFIRELFGESRRHFLFSRYHHSELESNTVSLNLLACALKKEQCQSNE